MDDRSSFSCPNERCRDYGKRGTGNVRLKERYGRRKLSFVETLVDGTEQNKLLKVKTNA